MPWPQLVPLLFAIWIAFAAAFALGYWLDPGAVARARPGSFEDAFFFSSQTLSTVGYGVLAPQTLGAHVMVTVESFFGLLAVSVGAGLAFSKFARPTARVLFSEKVVIAPRDGVPSLLVRMANARKSQIAEAQVRLTLVRDEVTVEGEKLRRFHLLPLVRDWTPVFALTWTIAHRLDDASLLRGATPESLARDNAEFLVSVVGLDLAYHQTVHARRSYVPVDIVWNARHADVLERGPRGLHVNYTRFHQTQSLES